MIAAACLAPALVFFVAFWLLPMAGLAALPASTGAATYFVVLTEPRYLASLVQTTLLSIAVTAVSLALAAAVGLYLGRRRFAGRRLLLSVLTLPLSFPGVIVGFFVILFGGRQGPIASLSDALFGTRITFAYGVSGLFLAYLYFSLPRAIASFTAVAERMAPDLEEAARSLGAGRLRIVLDVWWPALAPTAMASGAILFATSMGAFGTAFTLASRYEVLPITIYNEFTNYANFALAASLSIALGAMTWGVLFLARRFGAPTAGAAA
ncbi:MAG: ABC transporter permease subunit [Burkholderiales bacterium]|nr:ABC transporter permease subunit [Burkholderiales bacterium]MDE2395216.1 ABC transporter permease subunit [Burkholderiales bacterium]MDE2456500.1 ABC transporter permease subunit [Burkholderiales bacterium]